MPRLVLTSWTPAPAAAATDARAGADCFSGAFVGFSGVVAGGAAAACFAGAGAAAFSGAAGATAFAVIAAGAGAAAFSGSVIAAGAAGALIAAAAGGVAHPGYLRIRAIRAATVRP